MAQNLIFVDVKQDGPGGYWRVHVRKNPAQVAWGQHPEFTTTEADQLADQLRAAAQDARRRNAAMGRK
jgi:hypothetical protein